MTLSALFPGFVVAGALLALIPLGLHFFTRRPPEREPLPTARFLREDAPTLVRPQRKPTDLLLLAVRIGIALAIGAALAGLTWSPARQGVGTVVLVDGGADTLWTWAQAVTAARSLGSSETTVFLTYGMSDESRAVQDQEMATLQRGTDVASAEEGLRALREYALRETTLDTLSVVWLIRPTWDRWTPGVGLIREHIWPGRTTIFSPQDPIPWQDGRLVEETLGAAWVAPRDSGEARARETVALGGPATPHEDEVQTESVPPELDPIREALRALGHPLVVDSTEAAFRFSPRAGLPGEPGGSTTWITWAASPLGSVTIPSGQTVGRGGSAETFINPPEGYERVLAVDERGIPVAWTSGSDLCVVELGGDLRAPSLTSDPNYPLLIRTLVEGCAPRLDPDHPLSEDSRLALERPDLPEQVVVSDLLAGAESGRPLTPWLALLAVALLAGEMALTRSRRTERVP